MHRFPCSALLVACLMSATGFATDFRITPQTDLKSIVKTVSAGDSIILVDGDWSDVELTFDQLHGSEDAPIRIRAETSGNVVFSGSAIFRFSGEHIVVSGLAFRDTTGVSDVMQLRTHSQRHAHHCRVTNCIFEQTADFESKMESRWLSVYGANNRIDHCYFAGKTNKGTTLVVWVDESIEKHRIDHNHFGPRPELGRNGGETIRIGTSEVSELTSQTAVEDNYFFACDGESEIISNKSCENIYRHNVFDQCAGALTLRHGHRCVVDGNVFLGRKKRGTGGVRIIGRGHRVTNNYFEGLRGDAERAAISMMNGIPNSPLNEYSPVRKAIVAHNTFVDCKVSLEIGVGAGKKQPAAPADCRVSFNVFQTEKWALSRVHSQPVRFQWKANLKEVGDSNHKDSFEIEQIELQLGRHSDGLLRPRSLTPLRTQEHSEVRQDIDIADRQPLAVAGCDDPKTPLLKLPSPDNTGPSFAARSER